ncbi:MFS transporter [Phytoactinopolyspora mesophila]|nr:MFS transporter [Phytoactinopolyspora mesophila]
MAVGVSFGFARYGYGLFLPQLRAEFDLSVTAVGLIGAATYAGYLLALILVGALAARVGSRALITTGGLSAATGMTLVALAPGPALLATGLVLAGTSPGWIWAPYSDAAERMLPAGMRERVLARIPSGTAFGVAIAGPLALLTQGTTWRYAWLIFAAGGLAATLYNAWILPAGTSPRSPGTPAGHRLTFRWFARRSAAPLYLTAAAYGVVGSVYWLFAVESISSAGQSGAHTGALFWTLMGTAGTAAVVTGVVFDRLGLRRSHILIFTSMAIAVALLGLMPGAAVPVGLSALLYGPSFMAGSALLAVWSYYVFPDRPTTGFSATVFCLGIGTLVGPATAGAAADQFGLSATFLMTATVAILTNLLRPRSDDREQTTAP